MKSSNLNAYAANELFVAYSKAERSQSLNTKYETTTSAISYVTLITPVLNVSNDEM